MADVYKIVKITQPNPSGPLQEQLVSAINSTSVPGGTPADAGKVVVLNASGQIDASLGGGGSASPPFNTLSSGTNTSAAMIVGNGASLSFTGTGIVNANEIIGLTIIGGSPTHAGQLLISQPGNTSMAFADPLVQGLYPDGSTLATPPVFAAPTTIQPILIGVKGADGKLHSVLGANDGSINVNITGGTSGTQYAEGTTVATATGTVVLAKNSSNVVSAMKLDGSGNLDVNVQGGSFIAATGSGLPGNTAWIAASDGTNLQGLQVESGAAKNLRVAIFQGGNEVTVTSNRLLVDGSGVTQPVSIAGTVPQNLTQVGGSAITLGQKTMSASLPVVIASDQSRVNTQDAAEANANGSTAVPTNALYVGAKGADGFLHPLSSSTNDGKLDVNATFSGSVSTNFITDRIQSGNITNNQTVAINTNGAASVVFNITGTWTGTLQFQALMPDTTTWVPVFCYAKFPSAAAVSQTSANGQWSLPVGAINQFRVLGNTVASGTAVVNIEAGAGPLILEVAQQTAANLNATVTGTVTANQGTPQVTVANSWLVKLTDGTNPLGTSGNPIISQDKSDGTPGSASQPSTALQVAGWDGTHLRVLSTDASGNLNVNAAVSGTFTPALTADRTATGTITTTQNVAVSSQGTGAVAFNILGTWTGTILFEVSIDGINWVSAKAIPRYPTTTPAVSQTTANGQWVIGTGGINSVRVRGSVVASGAANIWMEAGAGAQDAETLSLITDGTNIAAVKAASTAPTTSDAALVVTLSPNSTQIGTSSTASSPATTSVTNTSASVLAANANRKEFTIVNTGTTVVFIGLGQSINTTAYHIALAACTTTNDGTGGTYTSDVWKGAVNAIAAASGTVCILELT